MLKLILVGIMFWSVNVFAQSKQELIQTLDMMKKNDLINEEQYQVSVKELNAMSDEDYANLKTKAETAKDDPIIQENIKRLRQQSFKFN